MHRTKLLGFFLLSLFASITQFSVTADSISAGKSSICEIFLIRSLAPWTSRCFYTSLYKDDVTYSDIMYELNKMNNFIERGGLPQSVFWYRSRFHQRFKEITNASVSDIIDYHWDYMDKDPATIRQHVIFAKYLVDIGEPDLAQEQIDKFCDRYIFRKSASERVLFLDYYINEQSVDLNTQYCASSVPK